MFNLKSLFTKIYQIFSRDKENKIVKTSIPTIREAILSQTGNFTVQEIVNITGKSRGSIGEIIRELRDNGVIEKYKDGTWGSTKPVEPAIDWGIPAIGSKPSVLIDDGGALNLLVRKTILSKSKLFTIPSIKAELRLEKENGRVQRVVYALMKEGLVKKIQDKDTTYISPANLYEVVKKG